MTSKIDVRPVSSKAELTSFIELGYDMNASDPHWVAPLRQDMRDLFDPKKNPFFEHAEVQPFIAWKDGSMVGRISAHFDTLAHEQPAEQGMGPGTGNWGLFEAIDAEVASALLSAAEDWLHSKGMHRSLGPLSLSIWDEPGLLTFGHDHSPTVMMGHNKAEYEAWVTSNGHTVAKLLHTYDLGITEEFPPLIQRIVKSGERSSRINIRRVDKSRFDEEVAIILAILNDAWDKNWGFVPFTDTEIAHIGKKLKPIVFEELIMIAEVEGRPVAFMITLPDLNEPLKGLNGSLFPFGWAKLLLWLRAPKARTMRVPLMGVLQEFQNSRLASQLAFMMIEYIRRVAIVKFGSTRGEIGWVLEDNQGMIAIADAINSKINRTYTIYEKTL